MIWLCLHFTQLPLEIFTRGAPPATDQARVIAQGQRVAFCNPAACRCGIRPGMSLATACALTEPLRITTREPEQEQTALSDLAQWAYRYTPAVTLSHPDTLLLEVGASLGLFQGLAALMQAVSRDLSALGYSHRAGIADTPKAAWLIARGKPGAAPPWFDPDTQQLNKSMLHRALSELPLQLLDCPPAGIARLKKPGFKTLGDILSLPRHTLGKRLGQDFIRYLAQLMGTLPDPQTAIEPESRFHRQLSFIDPIHHSETLLFPMGRLLQDLCHFLRARQLSCSRLSWQLAQQDADAVTLGIELSRPRHDRNTFTALTRTRLATLRLSAPVTALTLSVPHFSHCRQDTGLLFDDRVAQDDDALDKLLDKLRARLQTKQIYRLACRDAHVPEHAWQRRPVTQDSDTMRAITGLTRPSWLLDTPQPVRRHKEQLYWQGQALTLIRGPERIESHWWAQTVNRDYYIARQHSGALYWLFRDRARDAWYLHGIFG